MLPAQTALVEERFPSEGTRDSLFERFGWFYAFLRTRVFRNDGKTIASILRPALAPTDLSNARVLLELGCGPGFYACYLAEQFPGWNVLGVDRSHEQLRRACDAARRCRLHNCTFEWSDATALHFVDESIDAVLASRLFTVIAAEKLCAVMSEIYRVLSSGGQCFLAEPRSRWRAAIPLKLLWLLARVSAGWTGQRQMFREPQRPTVLAADEFQALVASQPWSEVRCWEDGHYQYALVRKGTPSPDGMTSKAAVHVDREDPAGFSPQECRA